MCCWTEDIFQSEVSKQVSNILLVKHIYTVSQTTPPPPFYILNNSAKNESILIILVYRILRKFHARKLESRPPHPNNSAALYLVTNNSSDAACRIVDNTPTGSCHRHPLITGKDYYKFGWLNIADKTHNRYSGDMVTYFVMYWWTWWSKTFILL